MLSAAAACLPEAASAGRRGGARPDGADARGKFESGDGGRFEVVEEGFGWFGGLWED